MRAGRRERRHSRRGVVGVEGSAQRLPTGLKWLAAWMLAAGVFGSISPRTADAAEAAVPPITRTVLERRAIPGTDQEMQMILVVFQPGAASPLHHHPEPGLNYILEGTAESAYGKETPKRYHAGDTLQDIAGLPHTIFRNPDPHKVLRFLIFANLHAGEPYLIVP